MAKKIQKKQFLLNMTEPLYQQLSEVADKQGVSVSALLRWFMEIGLLLMPDVSDEKVIITRGDTEIEIQLPSVKPLVKRVS